MNGIKKILNLDTELVVATMLPFSLLLSLGLEGLRTEGEIELGWIIFNTALIKVKVCPNPGAWSQKLA